MDHLASSKAASNFTTISFPDIPKDACVVQICTIPDEYLNNPFFRLFLAGFHAFHHYLSSLVVSEDLVQLSASDPQDHTDLVYGNKDVTGECSGTLVYKNPQELITVFLGKIIEMSNKVQSRREAGGTSSLIIIICGPTSLHQGIIRELSHPLTASTTLSLLTLDEIKGYIKCTKGATIITQSMLCNGWVIRPSLGALPTPGAINSGIIGTRLCRRIARNVSPLIQHLPLHEFLTSDAAAASSSPAKLNNDESLSAAKQEVHEAISESCNGFLSIPTKRPLFNLYEALDDWSRLCGERRGASMPRLWERWQLLPHARAENNQASTGLGSCLELKKTQARILALLEPNIFGEQLICQLFELDANSTWSSMNDKLDRVIQKSVHHLAMINFASLLVTFEGLPSAGQAKPIVLTETNLSITLNDGERAFVNGIANYSLNSLLRNQNYRDEIIRSHLTYVCFSKPVL
ncbi:hypothetical protein NW762_005798 [Fusarium torreyae]|uniref:Uncharacterized protein n=1 Tax=Fusarium torreyae TaxID=1237075 RepID=A0A9W8VHQ6_9HYPO|nr:hypothetical protein NW762_005798 [Fusarium torreyae]